MRYARQWNRIGVTLLAACLTSAPLLGTFSTPVASADPITDLHDFYDAPVADLDAAPVGDVVRRIRVGAPLGDGLGVDISRILYRSNDTHGEPMVVSGYTMTPTAPWPGPGPRPVIAYAPGTSGMADRCAGSRVLGTVGSSPAVLPLLLAGYRVVATDYQGLGTPGGHTYLNRIASGNALLDAARAGTEDPSTPVVLFGYSEGGYASAAAAELAASYAPDVDVVGAYVGASPADPRLNFDNLDNTTLGSAMLFAVDGLLNAYPEQADRIRGAFSADGLALLDAAQNWCSTDPEASRVVRTSELTRDGRPLSQVLSEDAADLTDTNTVGNVAPTIPIFLSQSVADDTVPIAQSRTLLQRWQGLGALDITYREYNIPAIPVLGANHAPGGLAAYPDVLPWIAALVS